jgi:hypothetical protein
MPVHSAQGQAQVQPGQPGMAHGILLSWAVQVTDKLLPYCVFRTRVHVLGQLVLHGVELPPSSLG